MCTGDDRDPSESSTAGAPASGGESGMPAQGRAGTTTGGTKAEAGTVHGGAGSSTLPEPAAWLTESARFEAVAAADFTQPACSIQEAIGERLAFAPLEWEDCGAGCESVDLLQGYDEFGTSPTASTELVAGGALPLLSFNLGLKVDDDASWLIVWRSVRLDTGATLGALRAQWPQRLKVVPCSFNGTRESAARVSVVGGNQGNAKSASSVLEGFGPLDGAAWRWATPALKLSEQPAALMSFDIDSPERCTFLVGAGSVYKQAAETSSAYALLEANSASLSGVGQGDLAVWTDLTTPAQPRVRGIRPALDAVRTLLSAPPAQTCQLALSPSRLVGLAAQGNPLYFSGCAGAVDSAKLWWSARPEGASEPEVTTGLSLPNAPFIVSGIKTWGDYAALFTQRVKYDASDVALDGDPYLLVVDLASSKTWLVSPPASTQLAPNAWTLTAEHLYFGTTGAGASEVERIRGMRRVRLTELDSYEGQR